MLLLSHLTGKDIQPNTYLGQACGGPHSRRGRVLHVWHKPPNCTAAGVRCEPHHESVTAALQLCFWARRFCGARSELDAVRQVSWFWGHWQGFAT
jgi:hypothetical protein